MSHVVVLTIAVIGLLVLSPPPAGAQALSRCFSDADCPEQQSCSFDQCLSCCPPSAEACIQACCGQCVASPTASCQKVLCADGFVPITDASGCDHGCRLVPPDGQPCGPNVCAAGEVCCNESCGICTPPDASCVQIACLEGSALR
jgi:hypothetical protein